MLEILDGLDSTGCRMDDVLVYGTTEEEHDIHLRKALRRIRVSGMTLNLKKCEFAVKKIRFLGHIIDQECVHPDTKKLDAVEKMPTPTNQMELKRMLGMENYLAKFVPHLTDILQPLTNLLCKSSVWCWDKVQDKAFHKWKELLISLPVLALFDVKKPCVITADASSYGLGAVLRQ